MNKVPNDLIKESSPYLLQHAYNPVKWLPWIEEAFELAKKEDKLIIISIGYSACHWCHVMEKESFEDEATAEIMNDFFINIKIDREERPDIDQVYMSAVQLMTGHGGWPLNCILLPDGRPIYGGTYFPNSQWKNVLLNLAKMYKDERERIEKYADELTNGLLKAELIQVKLESSEIDENLLKKICKEWKNYFDSENGGNNRAPKFPMPSNQKFLLQFSHLFNDENIKKQVHLTLKKMACGGIYDQIGGGFARYSVDTFWKVPHFEKMLYDNAQLISLYAEAYQESKIELYKEIMIETYDFVEKELNNNYGGWYSALDADSEGEEGKYYVWNKTELNEILNETELKVAERYFALDERAYWEDGNYILHRDESMIISSDLKEINFQEIKNIKIKLKKERDKRVKPSLDDKTLTSWNALMIKACLDLFKTTQDKKYLRRAEKGFDFFKDHLLKENGFIFHTWKNGKSSINGFLDDYAFTLEAIIELFLANGDEAIIEILNQCLEYVLEHFKDNNSEFFYYTSNLDSPLITRKVELSDNVIPSSNSQFAIVLNKCGILLGKEELSLKAHAMLNKISSEILHYPPGYSNWSMLALQKIKPGAEIILSGNEIDFFRKIYSNYYLPNCMLGIQTKESDLPLFKDRFSASKSKAYICRQKTCLSPIENLEDFEKQISRLND